MQQAIFLLDPFPFLEGTVLQSSYESASEVGIFHVTTQADILDRERVMKSRLQLAPQGIQGLGGGPQHSPDLVSAVHDLAGAHKLWGAMRTVVRAIHGEIPAVALLSSMIEWMGFPWDGIAQGGEGDWEDDQPFAETKAYEGLSNLLSTMDLDLDDEEENSPGLAESLLSERGWAALIEAKRAYLEDRFSGGKARYALVREFERAAEEAFGHVFQDEYDGPRVCVPTVGFVAPYNIFSKIRVDQIAIVQLACREGARVELEVNECEMRFRPEDTRVLRVRVEEQGPIPFPRAGGEEDDDSES